MNVLVSRMTQKDARQTSQSPRLQTSWTSSFLSEDKLEKYSVKIGEELIALGAYEVRNDLLFVHIAYLEAAPASNPTIAGENKKYSGIGKLLVAFGIKLSVDYGFGGDVVLEAKTTQLARHYEEDFHAKRIFSLPGDAPSYLIADSAAGSIFISYLEEEDK